MSPVLRSLIILMRCSPMLVSLRHMLLSVRHRLVARRLERRPLVILCCFAGMQACTSDSPSAEEPGATSNAHVVPYRPSDAAPGSGESKANENGSGSGDPAGAGAEGGAFAGAASDDQGGAGNAEERGDSDAGGGSAWPRTGGAGGGKAGAVGAGGGTTVLGGGTGAGGAGRNAGGSVNSSDAAAGGQTAKGGNAGTPVSTGSGGGDLPGSDGGPDFSWPTSYNPSGLPTPSGGQHNPGTDCASCHKAGARASAFLFGGTVYKNSAGVANVQVGVSDGKQTIVVYSATNGNFWSSAAGTIDWNNAVIAIRNANGTHVKPSTAARGASCGASGCHTTAKKLQAP